MNNRGKQPATLIMAVAEQMKDHSHWVLKILFHNQKLLNSSPIMATTVADFAPICDKVEEYIRERFGAGQYKVAIYRPNGEVECSYPVPVGGPRAYRGAGGNSNPSQDGEGDGYGRRRNGPYDEVMTKVMEHTLLEDPMDKAIQFVTAMQAIGGDEALPKWKTGHLT